ncbi:adenylosuccinate lyase [Buchnera aphidicola]|uniref:adenylosuccinate lyase n=1 Tax=Buchnera aphidicola TaxID=9 RepID=UPI0031B7ED0B
MLNSSFKNISPIDGRYKKKTIFLKNIFSEYGLLKYRMKIELKWFKKLSNILKINEIPKFSKNSLIFLKNIRKKISNNDIKKIKKLEKKFKHDIKSIEYFIKKKIKKNKFFYKIKQFVHFSCTSEDINNLAYALMLKKSKKKIFIPYFKKIISYIKYLAKLYKNNSLITRTHGQIATPSTMGKEMIIFYYRIKRQLKQFKKISILGKFNGSVGNYNAHVFSYPEINWCEVSKDFVTSLGLIWNPCTTQIESHDYIAELLNCITRINNILINFNRDLWGYISLDYFKQNINIKEIGSSIMPHKINPINFENSEGNLGISNALMIHMSNKLPITRWQRDLSDSTVLRNLGLVFGYSIIAYDSLLIGLQKIKINSKKMLLELNNNWQILAEPIQIFLKKNGMNNSYEYMKKITKGKIINKNKMFNFINNLKISKKKKKYLKTLQPKNYIGYAKNIIKKLM